MAEGREDERATFQFIDEVHSCPYLLDVSSAGYKDTKNKQKKLLEERVVHYTGQISTVTLFVQTFIYFSTFCFFFGD